MAALFGWYLGIDESKACGGIIVQANRSLNHLLNVVAEFSFSSTLPLEVYFLCLVASKPHKICQVSFGWYMGYVSLINLTYQW
jgi:hypothetical protein